MSLIMIRRPVRITFCSQFIFLQGDGNYLVEVVLESFSFLECDNRYIYIPPFAFHSWLVKSQEQLRVGKFDSISNNL